MLRKGDYYRVTTKLLAFPIPRGSEAPSYEVAEAIGHYYNKGDIVYCGGMFNRDTAIIDHRWLIILLGRDFTNAFKHVSALEVLALQAE